MCAIVVLCDLFVPELDIKRLLEKCPHLVVRKKQIVSRDNERCRLCPSPHDRERRQIARRDDQVKQVGRILQQPINELMHDRIATDVVIIIEDEDERLLDSIEHLVDQHVRPAFRIPQHLLARF